MGRVISELAASSREGNESARATLVRQGIKFIEPATGEAERLREAAARVLDRLGQEGFYSAAMLAKMRGFLEEFRARAGRAN